MSTLKQGKLVRLIVALLALFWVAAMAGCKTGAEPATDPVADDIAMQAAKGSFKVVGTGSGDADLLTPRAVKAIREADVVFCGSKTKEKLASLVDFSNKQVLDGYGVLFRYYGKDCDKADKAGEDRKRRRSMTCEQYHEKQAEFASLVREAVSAGKRVAMLSGGDPTIYGPDMWTLQELRDLDPTVVPGLSSFNAANAALKVSLGEVILTAPFKRDNPKDSVESLAGHERSTMVIFMPRDMKDLFSRLAGVYPADTPVAIVSNAGMAGRETVVSGTVGGFASDLSGVDERLSIVYVGKALENAQFAAKPTASASEKGKYYLVGLGPGDPDLATLRALDVIEKADLIFCHERLSEKFSDYLKGKKVVHGYHRLFPFYGKECAEVKQSDMPRERMSCEEYHRRQAEFSAMVREAVAAGQTVAMLDSGDPLVYGPCSWSLTELKDIDTEVVPGLSCFNAANAALRAVVTEGEDNHSVILASGWSVEEMSVHQSTMVLFTMRTDFKKFVESLSKHYPADRTDQEMKDGRMEEIKAVDPDGVSLELEKVSADLYKLKVEKAGAYLITAKIKPGFFTMTPDGRKWGDKTAISDAVKCTNFHIEAKTVLIAGRSDKNLTGAAGQALELIPLVNPGTVKSGEELNVKVLFEGAPLADTELKATYAGFEAEDIAPHDKPGKEKMDGKRQPPPPPKAGKEARERKEHKPRIFSAQSATDGQGQAKLQLSQAGYWMIMLSHRPPYPDTAVCDEYMYNVTFTFQIKP